MRTLHILFLLVFLPGLVAAQSTWNVPGDSATIQGAINLASSGDSIFVAPGSYPENLDLQGKMLLVQSTGGALVTTINGTGNDTLILLNSTPVGTEIDGFFLTGGKGHPAPSSYGYDYYGGAVHASNGANATIKNCYLVRNALSTGTFAGGAYAGGSGAKLILEHCVIAFNYAWASGGATLADNYGQIELNRCTVFGNRSTNFFGYQGGVAGANNGDTWIDDSIIWGNEGDDIGAFGSPYNVGVDFFVSYSDVDGGWSGTGNLNVDPLFMDTGNDDFALSLGSPCIDAGNPNSAPDPDGSRADMGALPMSGNSGLRLDVANLVSGGVSTATASGFDITQIPSGSPVYFCFSLTGPGSTHLPCGVILDILLPRLVGFSLMDTNGDASFSYQVGTGKAGTMVWAQAIAYDPASIPPISLNYQNTPVWSGFVQ